MGTGNYSHADGDTVILDLYDHIDMDEEDPDLAQILSQEAFSDFQMEVETLLKNTSFYMDGKTWRQERSSALIIASNQLYQIWSHEDSYGHVFITYGLHEDIDPTFEGMARHHLSARASSFFDRLEQIYEVRVATSAWTSAPRTPQAMAA